MRQSPDINAPILSCLAEGTVLKVLDGPVSEDGYRWWRVQEWVGDPPMQPVLVGPAGWVGEDFLGPYEY
jgi:hypothetical protein